MGLRVNQGGFFVSIFKSSRTKLFGFAVASNLEN